MSVIRPPCRISNCFHGFPPFVDSSLFRQDSFFFMDPHTLFSSSSSSYSLRLEQLRCSFPPHVFHLFQMYHPSSHYSDVTQEDSFESASLVLDKILEENLQRQREWVAFSKNLEDAIERRKTRQKLMLIENKKLDDDKDDE